MSRNKKPRKAYRPRHVAVNTMELALHRAAKPPAQDREEVLQILRKSHKALREGVATEHDWSVLAGSVETALTIDHQGVVRGLQEHLQTAKQALDSIHTRATSTGTWKPTALYFHELDALRVFVNLHVFQVKQLGRAEWIRAIDATALEVQRQGCKATVVRDIERMAA